MISKREEEEERVADFQARKRAIEQAAAMVRSDRTGFLSRATPTSKVKPMGATVQVDVKIPAIKHGYGQRDQPEKYNTTVNVTMTGDRVKVGDYEFSPDDLLEAVAILKQHNARR